MSSIKSLLVNFLKDERGSQNAEYVIIAGVVAGGAANGAKRLKDAQDAKTDLLIEKLNEDPAGETPA